jgi:hypothetical protein
MGIHFSLSACCCSLGNVCDFVTAVSSAACRRRPRCRRTRPLLTGEWHTIHGVIVDWGAAHASQPSRASVVTPPRHPNNPSLGLFDEPVGVGGLLAVSVGSGLLAGGSALLGHEQGAHAREGVHPPTMYGCGWR